MRYWDEMESKWGFDDGEDVPEDADMYRRIYVQAVNALAEKHGSEMRAAAYNRPGAHNWCLIMLITTADYATADQNAILIGSDEFPWEVAGADDAFNTALAQADELELDEIVSHTFFILEDELHETVQEVVAAATP